MRRNVLLHLLVTGVVILTCLCSAGHAATYYVSKYGNNTTGTSWARAMNSITGALGLCTGGDEIWVQRGTTTKP